MNENNLIKPGDLTPSERRANASKAGKASGASRRRKKAMKEKMKLLLELPCRDYDAFNEASAYGIDVGEIDNETIMLIGLYNKAKSGDVFAIREIRNILGKDNSSAELELKKKDIKLKEQAAEKNAQTAETESPSLYQALEADDDIS